MNISLRKYILLILIACVFTLILQQKVSRLYYRAYINPPKVYALPVEATLVDLKKFYNGSLANSTEENYLNAVRYVQNVAMKADNPGGAVAIESDANSAKKLEEHETRSIGVEGIAKPDIGLNLYEDREDAPVLRSSEEDNAAKTAPKRDRKTDAEEPRNSKTDADEVDSMYLKMLKCRKLPEVLIIGFEKCGTVTLKSYLGIHPQLFYPHLRKNYYLFNKDSTVSVKEYTRRLRCTPDDKLRLEKLSTWATAAKTVAVVPNAKLIAIVREPVERSMSHYVHRMAKGAESERYNFDSMIASIMDYNKPISLKGSVLFRQSRYSDRLEPWIKQYGLENIHIVDGDNFVQHPAEELQKVEEFLGLKPFIKETHFVYNSVKKFYCLNQHGNEACMSSNKGRPHPEMSNATRIRLQQYYKPYNEKLFMTIGRRFAWNY